MNETLEHISKRYSCRDFKGSPLSELQADALVKAALAAPSAMNLQPWHVILVTNKDLIDELDAEGMNILGDAEDKTAYERMMSRGGKLFYNAPCLVLVLSDGSDWAVLDCGIQCQNIVIAAESLGLGSCIVGMAGVPINGPKGDEYKKRLGFPEDHVFAVGVLVGEINSGKDPHELDFNKSSYVR